MSGKTKRLSGAFLFLSDAILPICSTHALFYLTLLHNSGFGTVLEARKKKTMATAMKKSAAKKATKKPAAKKGAAKKGTPKKTATKKSTTKKASSKKGSSKKGATKKSAAKKSSAKKGGTKKNKLGVKNSLVNNINAHKKRGDSKSRKKSSVNKDSYENMEQNWGRKK
jgi:hypothetical protein